MNNLSRSRFPWRTIAKSAPWIIWGLVALATVLRMREVTVEDLRAIIVEVTRFRPSTCPDVQTPGRLGS